RGARCRSGRTAGRRPGAESAPPPVISTLRGYRGALTPRNVEIITLEPGAAGRAAVRPVVRSVYDPYTERRGGAGLGLRPRESLRVPQGDRAHRPRDAGAVPLRTGDRGRDRGVPHADPGGAAPAGRRGPDQPGPQAAR